MLPTLTVLLDDGTGTFPADISQYVMAADGYAISRGREDWQGAVTAGELTLTLNNSDGRFTPGTGFGGGGFGGGGFGGAAFVDQGIRVKETINGVTYTRFTGYVKAWPVSWPATVATFSTVRLTATDAQPRAERRPLRSALEEEIFADLPAAYYTLGEPEGATSAGDTSGNGQPSLTIVGSGTAPVFGVASAVGDGASTAVTFANGKYLGCTSTFAGTGAWTVEAFVVVPSPLGGASSILKFAATDDSAVPLISIEIDSATGTCGVLFRGGGALQAIFTASTTRVVTDGLPHHVAVRFDGAATFTLYVDGVLDGTNSTASPSPVTLPLVRVGRGIATFAGTVSNVAIYNSALSPARIAAHASAGGSESGTARISRLGRLAGVPIGTLDSSLTTVAAATSWVGSFAWPEIQRATDAEGGLTYIDGSGNLTFHNRSRNASKTVPDLTLSSQWVTPDVNPVLDDQQIVNYMEVTAEGTGATGLVRSATSETSHGRYSGSQSYSVLTDQEALDRANWIISKFAEPTPRYGTLTINLFGMTAAQAAIVTAALDMDCWLRVVLMASQNPGGTTADVVVQSISETVTADTWTVSCNVVSRSIYTALVIDDPVFGVIDTYPVMF